MSDEPQPIDEGQSSVDATECDRRSVTGDSAPPASATRVGSRLARALGTSAIVARDAFRVYIEARAFDHAAAMTFFALLSVAPFLILLISAAGYIATLLGPEAAQVDWLAAQVTEGLRHFSPVEGEKVREVIANLVARRGSFGIIGGVVLLFGASMVFGAFEHALADIFGLVRRRKFLVSRAVFSALLVASGVIVFALHHGMTTADSLLLAWRGATLDELLRESQVLDVVLTFMPVPLGFLAAIYLPGIVRIRPTAALTGAAVFFVLWEIAREAYAFYVTRIASFGVLYGSVAAPLLVILWTFYSANIFLYAASVTAVIKKRHENLLASGATQE